MKPIIKLVTAFILIIFSLQGMYAQDLIHKKTGIIIEANIIEVGSNEIKYHLFNKSDNLIYAIEKIDIRKVEFENGEVETYKHNLNNPELYAGQKNQVVKVDFLAPLRGHTELTYGKMTKPGRGYELKLGLIGVGKQYDNFKDVGGYFSFSYKIARLPKFMNAQTRRTHILNGAYFRPEIIAGVYSSKDTYDSPWDPTPSTDSKTVTYGGFLLNFGNQWMVGNGMVIDAYFGFGYGADNGGNWDGVHYGMSSFGDGVTLATSAGISIGIPFGGK